MKPITKTEFDTAHAANDYLTGRWGYYAEAIRQVMELEPASVLEIGPGPLPLFHDSVLFDCDYHAPAHLRWDASVTPWPMGNDCVDVVVSLQTWEHLKGRQKEAFTEAMRVARRAVLLSVPWRWRCPDPEDCHNGIDEDTLARWTGRDYDRLTVVPPRPALRAVVLYWLGKASSASVAPVRLC